MISNKFTLLGEHLRLFILCVYGYIYWIYIMLETWYSHKRLQNATDENVFSTNDSFYIVVWISL